MRRRRGRSSAIGAGLPIVASRFEVQAREADRELIRALARRLAGDGLEARHAIRPPSPTGFAEFGSHVMVFPQADPDRAVVGPEVLNA